MDRGAPHSFVTMTLTAMATRHSVEIHINSPKRYRAYREERGAVPDAVQA